MPIRVVHTSKEKPSVYIGRAWAGRAASPLANPFKMRSEGERGAVVEDYRKWLWKKWQEDGEAKQEVLRIAKLAKAGEEVTLGCWCAPLPCHGDVVANAVNWCIRTGLV